MNNRTVNLPAAMPLFTSNDVPPSDASQMIGLLTLVPSASVSEITPATLKAVSVCVERRHTDSMQRTQHLEQTLTLQLDHQERDPCKQQCQCQAIVCLLREEKKAVDCLKNAVPMPYPFSLYIRLATRDIVVRMRSSLSAFGVFFFFKKKSHSKKTTKKQQLGAKTHVNHQSQALSELPPLRYPLWQRVRETLLECQSRTFPRCAPKCCR